MRKPFQFHSGNSPLLISMPHVGTTIPSDIRSKLTSAALELPDVDWHLQRLYDFAKEYDITVISAEYVRYVIDLNRSAENTSLYPGQDVTGLCPIDTFAKQAIYIDGYQPNENEVESRIELYWKPYHEKLTYELTRLHSMHGIAVLWDAHSIASHVPRFFKGQLPDLNFGTADSSSCDISLEKVLADASKNSINAKNYSHVFNGRFKGGYITRHYGKPNLNIHAVQLEMSQGIYMEESPPYKYDAKLAQKVKPVLVDLLNACLSWASAHK